jgi:DNA repair protein RecN (Recombination protein N)
VDTGVGGEAAWQVAERLARLAQKRQVLVVTHLPQIAARAKTHYRVVKHNQTVQVQKVQDEDRVRELARMLSGSYSEAALEHARELLLGPVT